MALKKWWLTYRGKGRLLGACIAFNMVLFVRNIAEPKGLV